ncbi:MAG: DUF6273 domain-containing protein [Bacilli bacterium]|nr:DUF6273 domain-containing protein [Bacilli bacterium]
MKKLGLLVMPLMAVSFLASCNSGGDNPEKDLEFTASTAAILDISRTIANIALDWTPIDHSIECSNFTFTLNSQSHIKSTITPGEIGSRPLHLTITFDEPLSEGDNGDLKFHYNDITAKKEGDAEIDGIDIKRTLEDCTWKEINEISMSGKAAETFKIGDTKTVKVNNKNHKVRIIGFNHDYSELPDDGSAPDSNKMLGITFEFANVITKNDGSPATTPWNQEDAKNYDYRSSTLNTFLNNDVLNMLPSSGDPNNPDLREVIKPVDKKVGVSTDEGSTYNAISFDGDAHPYPYLFPLAYDEITVEEETGVPSDEGNTYQYYKNYKYKKYRVKKTVGSEEGGVYFLRSPSTKSSGERATWITTIGEFAFHYVELPRDLAPAFCI